MESHDQFTTRPLRKGPSAGTVILLAIVFGALAGFGGAMLTLKASRMVRCHTLARRKALRRFRSR